MPDLHHGSAPFRHPEDHVIHAAFRRYAVRSHRLFIADHSPLTCQEPVRLFLYVPAELAVKQFQRLPSLRCDAVKASVTGDPCADKAALFDLGIGLHQRDKIDISLFQQKRGEPVHGDLPVCFIKKIQYDQFVNRKR